jgi:hypothetical protein
VLSLQDALTLYYREAAQLGLSAAPPDLAVTVPDPPGDLDLPLLNLTPDPGWRWTGEAWVRSGIGALRRAWEKLKTRLGLKATSDPREQLLQDLERALAGIKDWLREEVRLQLLDYGERLKFRYFFPLVDHVAAGLEGDLKNLLGTLAADLAGVTEAMAAGEADREGRRRRAGELLPRLREIEAHLAAPVAAGAQVASAGAEPRA